MDKAKAYFKGKKITVMGLGLLGKGLGDTIFLAQCGARLIVTDSKTKEQLATSIAVLKKFKNIKFVLGEHRLEDFENCDMILKAQGVPQDSIYIAHARKNKIPIRMDDELLISFLPKNVKVIGVTGTRGKTTVTSLIYHILKKAGKRVHLGGNIRGVATLSLLPKIKSGDIVVLELSSWQLQGFGESKISPHVSVFTNFMPDHMNYYKNNLDDYFADKAFIFKYQKEGDTLVIGESLTKKTPKKFKGNLIVSNKNTVPKNWKLQIVGEHNIENVALAIDAVRALKIPMAKIKSGVESFKAVEGRLQLVKNIKGISIYNDNNSTTPEATIVALKSFPRKQIVLIMGGADKNLDTTELLKTAEECAHTVILLPGTGSEKIMNEDFYRAENLKDALETAFKSADKGDVVLFSPGFASFGLFKNEYDRNDQFLKLVKGLK
ncbi:MAG: UDP-N-acetylmuramoyl-L-alanine--D-glutamate ligase [bacterium]